MTEATTAPAAGTAACVLVLNCGSSSVKYEVLDGGERLADGLVEGVGEPDGPADHDAALATVIDRLEEAGLLDRLDAVGHRMVHGGEAFTAPTVVDDDVVATLEGLSPEEATLFERLLAKLV